MCVFFKQMVDIINFYGDLLESPSTFNYDCLSLHLC